MKSIGNQARAAGYVQHIDRGDGRNYTRNTWRPIIYLSLLSLSSTWVKTIIRIGHRLQPAGVRPDLRDRVFPVSDLFRRLRGRFKNSLWTEYQHAAVLG